MKATTFLDDICRGDVAAVRAALDESPELLFAEGKNEHLWYGNANALAVAAMSGQVEVVRLLIERGAHLKTAAVKGISLLAVAAIEGRTEVVQLLLSAKVTPDIFAAAALGDLDRVKRLLQDNAAFVHERTFDGKTPLHFCRDVKMADVLLAAGADINALDDSEQTPLQWVAATGRFREVTKYLIEHGAKAESSDIFWACAYGDVTAVRAFLDADSSIVYAQRLPGPGVPVPMVGNTPLHEAAVRGELEIGGLLIQARITPLHAAAACGHLEMAKLLLRAGADPKARDGALQRTPGDWAKAFGIRKLRIY
jgi:ankyrin repeat protein